MLSDFWRMIIETCCGERQHVRTPKKAHEIIEDLECLAQDEFDKLYYAYIHARTKNLPYVVDDDDEDDPAMFSHSHLLLQHCDSHLV